MTCRNYRPDHNGECLNCDEPFFAHDLPGTADDVMVEGGKAKRLAPGEVRKIVAKMIEEGDILAVIVRVPSGDIAVQVFGPPSMDLVHDLELAVRDYRQAVKASQQ